MEIGRGFFFAQVGGVISTPAFPGPWAQSVPAWLQLLSRYPPPQKKLFSKEEPKIFPALVAAAELSARVGEGRRARPLKKGFLQ